MKIYAFGEYALPLYNKRDNLSPGQASGAVADIIGGGAYDTLGTADAPEGPVTVSTSFEIIETTIAAVQTKRDQMRALVGKRDQLWVKYPDGGVRFAWARLVRMRMERSSQFLYYQPVTLDFEIASPGWRGGASWTLDADESLDTGLLLDYRGGSWVPDASDYVVTITNGGNRVVTDARVVVNASAADTISQIRIRCGACDWTWKSTVPLSGVLVIDCGTKAVTLNGADAYTYMTFNAGQTVADWLQLQPGANTVTVSYTDNAGGTAKIVFAYYDMWA